MSENESKSLLGQNLVIVFGLAVVIGMGVFSWYILSNSGLLIESPENDYILQIPEEWEYVDIPATESNPIYGTIAIDPTDNGATSAFVLVTPYDGLTQDAQTEVDYISEVYADFGFEFLENEPTNLNGLDCVEYEGTLSDYLGSYYQKGFAGFDNNNKYMFIAQTPEEGYDETSNVFDDIIKSFKLVS